MSADVKCNSLNEWTTNNTTTWTKVLPQHQIHTSRRPGHQNVPCGFQTYLGRKELRDKENKRKQDKTCALWWEMEKEGRDFQNEASPFTKG